MIQYSYTYIYICMINNVYKQKSIFDMKNIFKQLRMQ